jgi:hypothetical protein
LGKVTNHPTIPNGDAIIVNLLIDTSKGAVIMIVETLSGSKYKLVMWMTLPLLDTASVKIMLSPKKKRLPPQQRPVRARSSITILNLVGSTIGNGGYLFSSKAAFSIQEELHLNGEPSLAILQARGGTPSCQMLPK